MGCRRAWPPVAARDAQKPATSTSHPTNRGREPMLDVPRAATARSAAALLLTGLVLSGCGGGTEDPASAGAEAPGQTGPSVRQVEVVGTEYEYDGVPDEAFPATYEITFVNSGEEPHELSFVELKEGTTARSVLDAPEAGEDPATLVEEFLGTTGAVDAGTSGRVAITLEEGKTYGYACLIEAADGTPHAAHGMLGEVRATTSAS